MPENDWVMPNRKTELKHVIKQKRQGKKKFKETNNRNK